LVGLIGLGQSTRQNSQEVVVSAEQEEFLKRAQDALMQGDKEEALKLATRAVMADQTNFVGYKFRGELNAHMRKFDAAVLDFTMAYQHAPRRPELLRLRARTHFKAGRLSDAIADWELFTKRQPDVSQDPYLFTLGIAYAIAGRDEDARKRFEWYDVVQSNDVEAAAWHYLAVARHSGEAAAQGRLLEIKEDERIPMMQVYEMLKGSLSPGRVLAAARSGEPSPRELLRSMFYANLYIGVYCEASGQPNLARIYLRRAAAGEAFGDFTLDYMREVVRVFADELGNRENAGMAAELAASPEQQAMLLWQRRSIAAGIGLFIWLGIRLYPRLQQLQPRRSTRRRRKEPVVESASEEPEAEPELVTAGEEGST
jgi:lipoprotein NlpI